MDKDISQALATEAKRKQLQSRIAARQAEVRLATSFISMMNTAMSDAKRSLEQARGEAEGLETAGSGLTDSFGYKSKTARALELEREKGRAAVVALVREGDDITFEEAVTEFEAAAETRLLSGRGILLWYRTRLLEDGKIHESSWQAHRQWIRNASDEELGLTLTD